MKNWNDQVLTESDIEQIYVDLINEYGMQLPQSQKQIAKELFLKLHNQGREWEWIYWAVWQLGERKIVNNKGLFFYNDYIREIDEIARNAHEYIFDNITMEELMDRYIQWYVLYEKENLTEEVYNRLSYFDDKYWNTEEEFTEEEMEELVDFYRHIVKGQLRTTRRQYEIEQRNIASAIRSAFGRIVDVAPHPFVNMEYYL